MVMFCALEACDILAQKNEEINNSIIQCFIGFNVQCEDGRISDWSHRNTLQSFKLLFSKKNIFK